MTWPLGQLLHCSLQNTAGLSITALLPAPKHTGQSMRLDVSGGGGDGFGAGNVVAASSAPASIPTKKSTALVPDVLRLKRTKAAQQAAADASKKKATAAAAAATTAEEADEGDGDASGFSFFSMPSTTKEQRAKAAAAATSSAAASTAASASASASATSYSSSAAAGGLRTEMSEETYGPQVGPMPPPDLDMAYAQPDPTGPSLEEQAEVGLCGIAVLLSFWWWSSH